MATFMGLAVGLISISGLEESKPSVTIETISTTNVLDLRRALQDLTIEFRGRDVQEQNLNLRIVTINVANTGSVDILQTHYAEEIDWGVQFQSGEVVEARLVEASSEYLMTEVVPHQSGPQTVTFSKVLLDRGSAFVIEVLLLHPVDEIPTLSAVGKIAGIEEISVESRPLTMQEEGYLTQMFSGSLLVQVSRALVYLVGWIAALVLGIFTWEGVANLSKRHKARRRRRQILKSNTSGQMEGERVRTWMVEYFAVRGVAGLRLLQAVIKQPHRIKFATPPEHGVDVHAYDLFDFSDDLIDFQFYSRGFKVALSELAEMGVLRKGPNGIGHFNQTFEAAVDAILAELEN